MIEPVDPVFHGLLAEQPPVPLLEVIVGRFGPQTAQMGWHGSHIGADGHAVVIENHDQRFPRGSGIVEALVGKSAGQGTVSDQGQDAVMALLQSAGPGHTQRHGDRIGGVSGDKRVMDALVRLGETGQPVQLAQGGKQLRRPVRAL